jgi:hypothetical protein
MYSTVCGVRSHVQVSYSGSNSLRIYEREHDHKAEREHDHKAAKGGIQQSPFRC